MDKKIPDKIIEELDINEAEKKPSDFDVVAIVEPHQVKLPIPKKLMRIYDLELKKGQKMKLRFDETTKELIYKI